MLFLARSAWRVALIIVSIPQYVLSDRWLLNTWSYEIKRGDLRIFRNIQMCPGERNELVCRKKNQSKGRVKTNAKANLPPPRQANSCARKWNIFAKANMVHVPHSKRLPSVCQRRAELE